MEPRSFAFHLTYYCPLQCAHCCFSCGPKRAEALSKESVFDTLRSLQFDTVELIAFTGGEPFYRLDELIEEVRFASAFGYRTRVVTSAFWADSMANALQDLKRLRLAGLDELSISWDDFHESQTAFTIDFSYPRNAFKAAKELGVVPAINSVQSAHPKWTRSRIIESLGSIHESGDKIVESPINFTGRAEARRVDFGKIKESYVGPCPFVMTGPTLNASKELIACCGVIPFKNELIIGVVDNERDVNSVIRDGLESQLLNWLYLRGPYSILGWVLEENDEIIPARSEFGGNCECCLELFRKIRQLDYHIEDRADYLAGEKYLVKSLGLDKNELYLTGLWSNKVNF